MALPSCTGTRSYLPSTHDRFRFAHRPHQGDRLERREGGAGRAPHFEQATGHKVAIAWGGTLDIARRVGAGEVVDIVILAEVRIDDLIAQGRLLAGWSPREVGEASSRCSSPRVRLSDSHIL